MPCWPSPKTGSLTCNRRNHHHPPSIEDDPETLEQQHPPCHTQTRPSHEPTQPCTMGDLIVSASLLLLAGQCTMVRHKASRWTQQLSDLHLGLSLRRLVFAHRGVFYQQQLVVYKDLGADDDAYDSMRNQPTLPLEEHATD